MPGAVGIQRVWWGCVHADSSGVLRGFNTEIRMDGQKTVDDPITHVLDGVL
jgi:hypothetical protein